MVPGGRAGHLFAALLQPPLHQRDLVALGDVHALGQQR
jgi:hypothetical protein